MDFLYRFVPHHLQQHLSIALSKLQDRRAEATRDPEKIKTIRGLSFVFLSLILGWASVELCQSNGIDFFQNSHWPSHSLFGNTLKSYSLLKQTNLSDWTSLLKTQPDAFSESSSIWVSENGCYVYLAKSPYAEDNSALFWSCTPHESGKENKTPWKNLGTGIAGFERLVEFLDKRPTLPAQTNLTRRNIIDPKEIRY